MDEHIQKDTDEWTLGNAKVTFMFIHHSEILTCFCQSASSLYKLCVCAIRLAHTCFVTSLKFFILATFIDKLPFWPLIGGTLVR